MISNPYDPNYKFPPIVRPAESAETTLARLDALADLNMQTCPTCTITKAVNRMEGSIPVVVGSIHAADCPQWTE